MRSRGARGARAARRRGWVARGCVGSFPLADRLVFRDFMVEVGLRSFSARGRRRRPFPSVEGVPGFSDPRGEASAQASCAICPAATSAPGRCARSRRALRLAPFAHHVRHDRKRTRKERLRVRRFPTARQEAVVRHRDAKVLGSAILQRDAALLGESRERDPPAVLPWRAPHDDRTLERLG